MLARQQLPLFFLVLMMLPLWAQVPDPPSASPLSGPLGQLLYVDGQSAAAVTEGWRQVVAKRPGMGGSAFVGPPTNRWTGLAVKALEKLPPEQGTVAAKELSAVLKTGVLHVALTSDGRAWYFFWDEGKLVDRYCSNPGQAGEVPIEIVRSWQGRPEMLLPVSRGTPLSKMRSEVSITDFNGFLYFYYPEMKATRPGSWRTMPDLMLLLVQVVGLTQAPIPFATLATMPDWTRIGN